MHHLEEVILKLLLIVIVQSNAAELCNTPKNEPGECVLLKSCPILLEMLNNKTAASMDFIRNSICGFDGLDSKVCCVHQSNSNNPIAENEQTKNNKHLLANRTFCGYQQSNGYGHNSNGTTITEFPWLARIVYRKKEKSSNSYEKRYFCMGSLLNTRYILTAAHCMVRRRFIPVEVQLGEYHIANDTDCVTDFKNIEECSDPTIRYGIEKVIAHSNYNGTNYYTNDIALIRLNGIVAYSDYVRPICLPYPGTKFAEIGNTLTISGWGFINLREKATIKKKVLSALISNNECSEAYTKLNGKITLTEQHICTVTFENSTALSCLGDAGAPVISQYKLQWHQEGIVSFRLGRCGSKIPDVHTRVEKYLDWIEKNIEP